MASWTQIVVLCSVLLTGAAAETNPELVRSEPGEDVTLDSGVGKLKESDWVVWSYGSNLDILVKYVEKVLYGSSERFQLDTETGSLTIRNLSVNDTGSYLGQIINGNTTRRRFNLTVEEPVLSPITAETSPGRKYWYDLIAPSLLVLIVMALVVVSLRGRPEVRVQDTNGPGNV